MPTVKVSLRPVINQINLPTVIKTATFAGDLKESLFIATQTGEIFYIRNNFIGVFLDIRDRILKLGGTSGYDERGLLGLAFHPNFYYNGLFYLHYSLAGSQGPGALSGPFRPNPCDPESLSLKWTDREMRYDHIDTVEEWQLLPNSEPAKVRTLLNLIRPFANHNGVNSLTFSPETGRLVLTTGDGGLGYDPFNLAQDDMEIAGKIIELDVSRPAFFDDPPAVTRFDELPWPTLEAITIIAKGIRNIPGISYQRKNNQYIKYTGNVGQDLVESLFWFNQYNPVPAADLVQAYTARSVTNAAAYTEGLINLGWRGWEGDLPTSLVNNCPDNNSLQELIIAYYEDAIRCSNTRLTPLTCYYHIDSRPGKFAGTALTGVQVYSGSEIAGLSGSVVFTDLSRKGTGQMAARGVLAYCRINPSCKIDNYQIIETAYDFGQKNAFYTCLGTNQTQSKLYLGVYGSMRVTDLNMGCVFEIVPMS